MTVQAARLDERGEPRQDVLHRTRAVSAHGTRSLTIVNVSPQGLMARTADPYAPGDRLTVTLPGVEEVAAEVRWALGGRIGCRLDRAIGAAEYRIMLNALLVPQPPLSSATPASRSNR